MTVEATAVTYFIAAMPANVKNIKLEHNKMFMMTSEVKPEKIS